MKKLIQGFYHTQIDTRKIDHEIKEDDNFYYVSVKMKMNKDKTENVELINNCFNFQQSPITSVLGEMEKSRNRDKANGEAVIPLYTREKEDA